MPYLIAEMGCNHNGSLERAKEIIRICASAGADAVKGQKRDIFSLYSNEKLNAPYLSEHAYGGTYGEHRKALEFDAHMHGRLYQYAQSLGIDYAVSVWDLQSLHDVRSWVPWIKIPSACAQDLKLIDSACCIDPEVPVYVSDGGCSPEQSKRIPRRVRKLLCTSEYPTPLSHTGLGSLWIEGYHGVSGHWDPENFVPDIVATALGANVIERHVTLDRGDKGSDHKLSLDPELIYQWVRSVRDAESVCTSTKALYPAEKETMKKLRSDR